MSDFKPLPKISAMDKALKILSESIAEATVRPAKPVAWRQKLGSDSSAMTARMWAFRG